MDDNERLYLKNHSASTYTYWQSHTTEISTPAVTYNNYYKTNFYLGYSTFNYAYTDDLVNWDYTDKSQQFGIVKLPRPKKASGSSSSANFQNNYGLEQATVQLYYFKGYFYIIGGIEDFCEENPEGKRLEGDNWLNDYPYGDYSPDQKTIKRISIEDAPYGEDPSKWEQYTPSGMTVPQNEYLRYGTGSDDDGWYYRYAYVSYDGETLYITGGATTKWKFVNGTLSHWVDSVNNNIYATTDGKTWSTVSSYSGNNARYTSYVRNYNDYFSDPNSEQANSLPYNYRVYTPSWTQVGDYYYQIIDNNSSSYSFINYPYDEINAAADLYQTNITITDEIRSQYLFNDLIVSKVHPNQASDEDWKIIKANNYVRSSLTWAASSPNFVFELEDSILRLIDYDKVPIYCSYFSQSEYNYAISNAEYFAERAEYYKHNNPDSSLYRYYCYNAIIYNYQAELIKEALIANMSESDCYPNDAIRAYILDLAY